MTASDSAPDRRSRWARAARPARLAYLAALSAAVLWLASTRRAEIVELLEGTRLELLVAALAASFGLIGLGAALWHSSLRMLGHPVAFREIVTATARSLPARYVPLGVTYAAVRVTLLRAAGAPLTPLTATAGLEMVVSASVALAAGVGLLGATGSLPGGPAWTAAAIVGAVLVASPVAGGRAVARLLARRGIRLEITWRGYLRVLVATMAYWGWASATFVLYLRAFPAADGLGAVESAGAFMAAWAVGFLTLLAPQGIGVAELGLVALLASGDRGGVAMAAVFGGYRVVQIARDVLAAATAEVITSRRARRESEPTG